MMAIRSFIVLMLLRAAIGGIIRKPPAFSAPMYSDSYLPAAMQVIFHSVEQLKLLESEETLRSTTTETASSPLPHIAQTERPNAEETSSIALTTTMGPKEEAVSEKDEPVVDDVAQKRPDVTDSSEGSSQRIPETTLISTEDSSGSSLPTEANSDDHRELPEMNEETPETNYATPEANYELPETVHGVQETNQEVSEASQEESSLPFSEETSSTAKINVESFGESTDAPEATAEQSTWKQESSDEKKKEPTIDSIVEEIYEIVKPTPSELLEGAEISGLSKSSAGLSIEKMESIEEEEEETRFTLLGEKVAQVPRPSLSSYLRRAKVPPSGPLQQLANLYDSLSKDARKQGFGKFTGYSDAVLKTLEASVEGGVGPQLKTILEKVLERNELTREDARTRTSQAVRDLGDPSSELSKALRRLLPLRYSP